MNPRKHIRKSLVLAAVGLLAIAAAAFAARAQVSPDPVTFTGGGTKIVKISNPGPGDARWNISVSAGAAHFKVKVPSQCRVVPAGKGCVVRVLYAASGGEDRGTLSIVDQIVRPNSRTVDLIGHPGSGGGGGGGGGNGPNCTLHVARHQKLVKKAGGKTVRTPYKVSLTSSEDGTVAAQAVGKTARGKQIFLESANAQDTAGNGVVMTMKLGRKSENLIRAELAAGRSPKMTLTGGCSTPDSHSSVSAKLHFSDRKSGRGFKLPLEADATTR
jgi:opacity protein-like surface antigen